MASRPQPGCHPMLIGSLSQDDHQLASRLIMDYSPAIPLWVQLPVFAQEKMVPQFLPGMPGVASRDGNVFIDTIAEAFAIIGAGPNKPISRQAKSNAYARDMGQS